MSEGRLYWIRTPIRRATGSPTPRFREAKGTNYIRNSVKIVIDAYNGAVEFYVFIQPIRSLKPRQRIFPTLFKPLEAMPPDLGAHVRYPEDLFALQARQYRAYHMDVPEVFYNREDLWKFPRQTDGPEDNEAGDNGLECRLITSRCACPGRRGPNSFS